ncbi:hypothetical protein IVB55_18020 [Bradyrhizobium sp. CW4]|uniref:hypothetical protein n=1 Tax=Bradyrhizobium sp. CW4 TaxID=2782687 RepID=UPI001FF966D8|nr:hypothetical protein [Bradyrhizobium sp. CW4]MCK1414836.1 hypothetical protein [Bradyrhizobium sp. CW4]
MSERKRNASDEWVAQFRPGHVVADYDKEPGPNTNQGKVEKVVDDQLVRVLWKDGTTSDRPANILAKITNTSGYTPDPAKRKALWDKILQMSDEEMDAEIERLQRQLKLN